jgi:hypothetical protein
MASLLKNNTNTINDLLTTINNLPNAITIDATLTKAGQAADAKAVGDALNEKQPIGDYALKSDIPTVHDWAKEATKPAYTASEVGAASSEDVRPITNEEVDEIFSAAGLILPAAEEVAF